MTPIVPDSVVGTAATANLVLDSYHRLPAVIARVVDDPAPVKDPGAFSPGGPAGPHAQPGHAHDQDVRLPAHRGQSGRVHPTHR